VEAVRRHIPALAPFVSDTPTPMHYTAELVRKEDPEAVTVFVGPCAAKRQEALGDECVDYVLTTEELGAMFVAAGIEVGECEPVQFSHPASAEGRGFAVSGGVTAAVTTRMDGPTVEEVKIDGIDKKVLKALTRYAGGKTPGNFIEVMACEGGCVGGPCTLEKTPVATRRVNQFAQSSKES
jgi:iron only hydrogenase large subunit-like protein